MVPGTGLKVNDPTPRDKQVAAVPIKKQPRKNESSRVYEYVPDLELRLSIREGTYLRMNSRKHRNDELMLLMREAQKEKTPQMVAECRLARQIRIKKRRQARIRAGLARNQMPAAGVASPVGLQANAVVLDAEPLVFAAGQLGAGAAVPVALQANEVVLDAEPIAFATGRMGAVRSLPMALMVNRPMVPAMRIERPVAVVAETGPVVAEQAVDLPKDVSAKLELLDVAARFKAEKYARKVESVKRARAAKAAKKAEADKQKQQMEAARAAAQPIVSARAVTIPPWLRQYCSEASGSQEAIAATMNRAITNGQRSSDAEVRAANRAILADKAGSMPGVRVVGCGPVNGRNIEGSLMVWCEGQVLICCHCHASILSPSAFVMHAGHVEFEDPLKLIRLFYPTSLTL